MTHQKPQRIITSFLSVLILLIYISPYDVQASEIRHNISGNFGLPGLIDLPTARRLPDGESDCLQTRRDGCHPDLCGDRCRRALAVRLKFLVPSECWGLRASHARLGDSRERGWFEVRVPAW